MHGIYHLDGTVKHYDWGGFFFLPALLKQDNKDNKPFAEYWIGTHPLGNSQVEITGNARMPLTEYAGPLPFLLKILDVNEMLSIQVHPSRENARAGFARENAAGTLLDSPTRNYKDENHKPEMVVAISDFWLLHGFKSPEDLHAILVNVKELNELIPIFAESGYAGLYKHVMLLTQEEVNRLLEPLSDRIIPLYKAGRLKKSDEDHWAAKAILTFSAKGDIDRGLFSIYFFNLISLKSGEGIFQQAGLPHAYLQGQIVEIMSNSDNVLRGGLTRKHIDVNELLGNIEFEATYPEPIIPVADKKEKEYPVPVNDFSLSAFEIFPGEEFNYTAHDMEILLLTAGSVFIDSGKTKIGLEPGTPAAIISPGESMVFTTMERTTIYRASGKLQTQGE